MATFVYRFTHDLRLEDHAGLATAAHHGEILPVLVLDPQLEARLIRSPRRAAYYCAAVLALDAALRERGSQLIVRRGEEVPVLREIAKDAGAAGVAWSVRYDRGGIESGERLQSGLEERGLRALAIHDAPAIAPEETSAARPSQGDGYRAFVPYFELWRTLHVASYEIPLLLPFARSDIASDPLPEAAQFGSTREAPAAGGEDAWHTLRTFLAGDALRYAVASHVPADDRTSHLSAALSFGTISARTVVRETVTRSEDIFLLSEERASLRAFLRSLAMRDFFLQLSWYHPQTDREPLQERMRGFSFAQTHPALEAWRFGETGYPIVDAGMRQLRATGWMHPRVRSVAASFLCFDLGVDWRVGRDEWDSYLVEDDAALATGNWQWIAGVGADLAAYPRIYNPRKQARQYDPQGHYARTWIAELSAVPEGALDAAGAPSPQISLPLFSDTPYPAPIVEHENAAREFLRKRGAFLEAAPRR
ncbi:MAG: DNA photolyase family protein [Candidatus Eremiobacteraeota bacterium]|nr:DNA photolyase family protein [Candidatus Eremiobacteraeota bacterium]